MDRNSTYALWLFGLWSMMIIGGLSCTFQQKIKDGDSAYERKQYSIAAQFYMDEYGSSRTKEQKGQKAYYLAKSLTQLLRYQDAEQWFEKAVSNEYGAAALIGLGQTQKILENYDGAIATYDKLGYLLGYKQDAQREILICRQAKSNKQSGNAYAVERIQTNSLVSEYAPAIYDQDFLVFTSESSDATGKSTYEWTGERYADLFVMPKNGSEIRRFDAAINTPKNEGAACFSKDMNTMYFNRCFSIGSGDEHCKIMVSTRVNDVWSDAVMLPFIMDGIQYKHPALIESDSVLVFSSDLLEPGAAMDLYYVTLDLDGTWTEPEAFPSTINTSGNEIFPVGDGDTLYFSSDFLPSLGGFDIYKTFLKDNLTWSIPQQMPYPINSGGDDFSFVVDHTIEGGSTGYFSSSRHGVGKDDIFKFTKRLKKDVLPIPEMAKIEDFDIYLAVVAKSKVFEIPTDPNSRFISNEALGNTYLKVVLPDGKMLDERYTDGKGIYVKKLDVKDKLKIIASKEGYLNSIIEVTIGDIIPKAGEKSVTINTEVILDKIFEDREVNIPEIYYAYDKWDLRPESLPVLDKLVALIQANPQVDIALFSHTDCRGDDSYNDELSQRRAQSVLDYLTLRGVDIKRLSAQGMGKRALLDLCQCALCNEDQHQINRRTTFKIVPKKK